MMYERGFYFREEPDGLEVNLCLLPRKNIQYYLNLDPLDLEGKLDEYVETKPSE